MWKILFWTIKTNKQTNNNNNKKTNVITPFPCKNQAQLAGAVEYSGRIFADE